MSEPVRHRVAANARDLPSIALRDALPGAADGSVTLPMSLATARACRSSMVAQARPSLASPASNGAQPSTMRNTESMRGRARSA
ncbi:hypothetical protein DGN16_01705 [Xanthomonas citri pv. fuscans]|uniref:Uncharacterized protein n=1 Tax=Xanthomonas citri pv. phaseoli var. fuscans TaxID=473423 RepID=A0A808FFS3_XANCI|nr:hypothetical protein XcvCFBP7112P_01790 [Xanthomonas citri pv. vignicola]ASK99301.1 hypothetical protein XcvCFBP7113P_01695 [Xanthomonas citri pv. vignicola]QWN02106.1 hypothetical protein DGN16_01705 [Xanthomonas citri pv. fuscans]QWN06354.1 hypothetical protein DGN11_01690 [Xanthomonas citri pv. fuscans]QWN10494.1 hypothetical protein DGN07_01725 [Xanthomonas citri pv. fuscans]